MFIIKDTEKKSEKLQQKRHLRENEKKNEEIQKENLTFTIHKIAEKQRKAIRSNLSTQQIDEKSQVEKKPLVPYELGGSSFEEESFDVTLPSTLEIETTLEETKAKEATKMEVEELTETVQIREKEQSASVTISHRPKWSLTKSQNEELNEIEMDELLDFVQNLEFDKYIEDLEFMETLQSLKNRVSEIEKNEEKALLPSPQAVKTSDVKELAPRTGIFVYIFCFCDSSAF